MSHQFRKKLGALAILVLPLAACGKSEAKPLWEGENDKTTKTSLVISDLHLGIDAAFAENTANLPYLKQFLDRVRVTKNLDELVIAGDMFDGWFLPFSYGPIGDYLSFYQKVASANKDVVDAINAIIKDGRISVVYVPGNHDVDFSCSIAGAIFPGIAQARDSEGVGTYRTGSRKEIVIEHGHRYNVFCAPDCLTDTNLRKGETLMGPGYFYTRIAATSLKTGHNPRGFSFPDFGLPEKPSESVLNAYKLYKVWDLATQTIGVANMTFESKVIPCGIAGYADYYAFSDLVPLYRDGALTKTLFENIDANWQNLQIINRVNSLQEYGPAVIEAASLEATDAKSISDYFKVDPTVDVVVFGHTHAPRLDKNQGGFAGKTYVNTGTWIDHNLDGDKSTRTYVKLVSGAQEDQVSLWSYETDGSSLLKAQ